MPYALLITHDDILAAQFQKMCAVTQSELVVLGTAQPKDVAEAYRVFVDHKVDLEPFTHDQVVILASDGACAKTWQLAVQLDAKHVEVLPTATNWLIEHLVPPVHTRAQVVSITPVVGGAGASTLACALAGHYAAQGLKVALVDADPRAGGLDVVMGCEQAEGMRWVDILSLEGSVAAPELFESLIIRKGIHLIAPRRGQFDVDGTQIITTIDALASACDVVVIDTPRLSDELAPQLIAASDEALLVTPTTVQASSLLTALKWQLPDERCGLVVRQIPGSGLTAVGVAQAVELPLRATLPTDARIVEQVEQGLGLSNVTLGAFSRSVNQLSNTIERNVDIRTAA